MVGELLWKFDQLSLKMEFWFSAQIICFAIYHVRKFHWIRFETIDVDAHWFSKLLSKFTRKCQKAFTKTSLVTKPLEKSHSTISTKSHLKPYFFIDRRFSRSKTVNFNANLLKQNISISLVFLPFVRHNQFIFKHPLAKSYRTSTEAHTHTYSLSKLICQLLYQRCPSFLTTCVYLLRISRSTVVNYHKSYLRSNPASFCIVVKWR